MREREKKRGRKERNNYECFYTNANNNINTIITIETVYVSIYTHVLLVIYRD